MILPFSEQLNGNKTYFPEKILTGLINKKLATQSDVLGTFVKKDGLVKTVTINAGNNIVNVQLLTKYIFDFTIIHNEKLHTIREDKKNRWQPGVNIDFFINARKKNMFRFAPVLPVVSIQDIEIVYYHNRESLVNDLPQNRAIIIGKKRLNNDEIKTLAQNDGFNSVDDFFTYFNTEFKGKIIHWTDLKY
ncbi:hypothetical protein [Flavobacterium covae]|uniref:hypothetical protein n=1 Tax=Flavobacterium covae TaxID=2906076 RepID=UPI000745E681|nr:hypothetical protein [Flavobacterium covae]AMA48971.1 hypothetical protein AWN65_05590 [Flavobacterium covae]MCJ1809890.1 hypothetical protein [Flavobacterium covae]